jgi:hypothetical protein
MVKKLNCLSIVLTLIVMFAGVAHAAMATGNGQEAGHGMSMHHQHIMLNHALGMVIEGSNMEMLGQMGMEKGIDEVSVEHGKMMMKQGRAMYDEIMSGDTMMKMHSSGKSPKDDPMMKFTHELAGAQLKVMEMLKQMSSSAHAGHGMAMHHQHTMLNHALGMTLSGSNMVMLGQMGMAKGVDEVSVEHGKMMMKDGQKLWNEIMSGKSMMKTHKEGTSPKDNPGMAYTHKLAEAQMKVMNLLLGMPPAMT